MGKRTPKAYWIWGQFSPEVMSELNKLKAKVDSVLNGPYFEVHLTVASSRVPQGKEVVRGFYELQEVLKPVELRLKEYATSEKFYRSLFIVVEKSAGLLALKKRVEDTFGIESKPYSPHISLYYGHKSEAQKAQLIETLPEFPSRVSLNRLCLVHAEEHIDRWKVVHEIKLKS